MHVLCFVCCCFCCCCVHHINPAFFPQIDCGHRWSRSPDQRGMQGQRHSPSLPHPQHHHRQNPKPQPPNHKPQPQTSTPKPQPPKPNAPLPQALPSAFHPPPSQSFSPAAGKGGRGVVILGRLPQRDTGFSCLNTQTQNPRPKTLNPFCSIVKTALLYVAGPHPPHLFWRQKN